jgi:hypothetical protein
MHSAERGGQAAPSRLDEKPPALSIPDLPLTQPQKRLAGDVVQGIARAGYAARGFVYLSVGILALRAAYELHLVPAGTRGAVAPIGQAPLGGLWLILIGAGLLGFALWRGLQAVVDADHRGTGPHALVQRFGQGLSCLGYIGMALSIFTLLDNLEDLHEGEDQAQAAAQAAWLMGLPFGQGLLIGTGLFIVGLGLLNVAHGFDKRFQSALDCSVALKPWAGGVGRAGYIARGVAFALMGASFVRAGMTVRAADVTGLGGALMTLRTQHGGPLVLGLMAVGLIAFGVFGLIEARYRLLMQPGGDERC